MGSEYTPSDAEVVRAMFRLYNTPAGSSVSVAPAQLSTITFAQVADSGRTSVVAVDQPAGVKAPPRYTLLPGLHDEVATTARVRGPAVACFLVPSITDAETFGHIRILQQEHQELVDRTILSAHTELAPDFASRRVCANTPSIGRFAIALQEAKPAKTK